MARPSSQHPTELELEILKVLWKEGPLPVRAVRDALTGFRDLAHTSVMTIMGIMTKKRYLRRTKTHKGFVYRPAIERGAIEQRMLKDLVVRLFDGSVAGAAVQLFETGDINETELEALRTLVGRRGKEEQS